MKCAKVIPTHKNMPQQHDFLSPANEKGCTCHTPFLHYSHVFLIEREREQWQLTGGVLEWDESRFSGAS